MPVRVILLPPRNSALFDELCVGSGAGDVLNPQGGDVRGIFDVDAGAGAGANYFASLFLADPRQTGSSHVGEQSLVLCLWGEP